MATLDDYAAVYALIQHVLGQSMSGLTDKARDLCQLLDQLAGKGTSRWVLRPDLERAAGVKGIASPNTVRSWGVKLCDLGIWEGRKPSRTWEFRCLRDPEVEAVPLPRPEELISPTNEYQSEPGSPEGPAGQGIAEPTRATSNRAKEQSDSTCELDCERWEFVDEARDAADDGSQEAIGTSGDHWQVG